MATMKSLEIWIKCPKYKPTHRSIDFCFKCDYYVGNADSKLFCIFEEK